MAGDQLQHLAALLELHAPLHAGPLQRSHQPAAIVDLAVLFEQQARPPARPDTRNLPFQAAAIQGRPPGGGGVTIPFGGVGEGHDDAAGPQAAAQVAVGFDFGHPGWNALQGGLPQPQQGAADTLGVGGEHAGGHEAGGLAAAAAEHQHRGPATGQLMRHGQAHQAAAEDQDRWMMGPHSPPRCSSSG